MSFLPVEEHPWFVGSMEREKAEQFLREVSTAGSIVKFEKKNELLLCLIIILFLLFVSIKHL